MDSLWTNRKNGRDYVVIGVVVDANNHDPHDKPQTLYRSVVTGEFYFRDPSEFSEKFTRSEKGRGGDSRAEACGKQEIGVDGGAAVHDDRKATPACPTGTDSPAESRQRPFLGGPNIPVGFTICSACGDTGYVPTPNGRWPCECAKGQIQSKPVTEMRSFRHDRPL